MSTSMIVLTLMTPPVGGYLLKWLIALRIILFISKFADTIKPNVPSSGGHFADRLTNDNEPDQ